MPVSGTSDAVYADELYTGRICPVPNSHAGAAIAVVLLYSAVFLFYAQYHFAIMLVMTSIIAVLISLLYATGLLYVLYLMLRLRQIEQHACCDANDCNSCTAATMPCSSTPSAQQFNASTLSPNDRISVVRIACGDYVFPYDRPIQVSEVKL